MKKSVKNKRVTLVNVNYDHIQGPATQAALATAHLWNANPFLAWVDRGKVSQEASCKLWDRLMQRLSAARHNKIQYHAISCALSAIDVSLAISNNNIPLAKKLSDKTVEYGFQAFLEESRSY